MLHHDATYVLLQIHSSLFVHNTKYRVFLKSTQIARRFVYNWKLLERISRKN